MTYRITVHSEDGWWFVTVDVLDSHGQKIDHAGDTLLTLGAALDFVEDVIGQAEDAQ